MCDLVCDDGSRFKVRSGIDGHLLEMNKRLGECPDPINNKPRQEGYIAIIQPKRDEGKQSNPRLIKVDEYRAKRPGVLV
jgi:glycine cleavage system H lipoate-binding protein